MKLKKLLSILLAVALVLAMTVSVSASKRLDINGEIVIGTLEWSGTPRVCEVLTATTKMRISNPTYFLRAELSGIYKLNNGTVLPTDIGYEFGPNNGNGIGLSVFVNNGCWLRGDATYDAYYESQHTTASETKQWNV